MDKKEIVIQAEKFLNINLLYGTISGIRVKDYLEMNADKIVKDGWGIDETASRIEDSMYSKETGEPLFISAGSLPLLPIQFIDKEEFVTEFINKLPYKDKLRIGPSENDFLIIEDELRRVMNLMDDEFNILIGDKKINIKEYYNILLKQEYISPSRTDKIDVIMAAVRELRERTPNFDKLSQEKINGKSFEDLLVTIPDKMNDNMDVLDGMSYVSIGDYLANEFKKVSEYFYNSINSKPTSVETISLSRGENNKLEATNEYIFMSDEEEKSVTDEINADREDIVGRLYYEMLIIKDGINKSLSSATLSLYEDRITSVRNELRTIEDPFLKSFYEGIIADYTMKQDEFNENEKNFDDIEVLLSTKLNDVKELIKDIETDYHHTYENVSYQIEPIISLLLNLKMDYMINGIKNHNDIDVIDDTIRRLQTTVQYSMENVNHNTMRVKNDIDNYISRTYSAYRAIEQAQTTVEKTACTIKAEDLKSEFNKYLDKLLEDGIIDEVEHHNYLNDLNKKIGVYETNVRSVA